MPASARSASTGAISGNITDASTGATTNNVSVTGSVAPAVQFSTGSETINQTTGTFSIAVTISGNPTVTSSTFASGFSGPTGEAFDAAGNLYVGNATNNMVSKVTPAGVVSTFASGFSTPDGLAFDTAGNLYVSNYGNGTVSKVTPAGVVSTFASGFTNPSGLAFDAAGNLYVANLSNDDTVSKVTLRGRGQHLRLRVRPTPGGLAFDRRRQPLRRQRGRHHAEHGHAGGSGQHLRLRVQHPRRPGLTTAATSTSPTTATTQ